jgi:murein DD-endopeptidase MepM/ murein hydrolase activator NlpD
LIFSSQKLLLALVLGLFMVPLHLRATTPLNRHFILVVTPSTTTSNPTASTAPNKNKPKSKATPKKSTKPAINPKLRSSGSSALRIEPLYTPNIIENMLQMPTPEVVKASSALGSRSFLQRGCLPHRDTIEQLLESLGIIDQEFENAFNKQVPGFFKVSVGVCLPFAISQDSNRKVQAFSILSNAKRERDSVVTTIYRSQTTDIFLVDSQTLATGFENYLEVILDLNDLIIYKANKATTSIPPELIWELGSLVKELYPKDPGTQERFARVVYDAGNKDKWAQVISFEILDKSQKNVLASAFWIDRDDIPGGFFTALGTELEQTFWISPLNYTRISRGVGQYGPRALKSIANKKNSKTNRPMRLYGNYSGHQGIDFSAPQGTPIYAVANGKIIQYGPMAAYGNLVIVEHPGNYKTYYAHLSAFNPELQLGSEVRRGLEIGYVGSTGRSTGPHLHFEIRKNNLYLNPLSNMLELDLWTLRPSDQPLLTKSIVLFSSQISAQ